MISFFTFLNCIFSLVALNISILQSRRFSSPIRKIVYITYNLMDKKFPESGRLSNLCTRIGLFSLKFRILQNQEELAAPPWALFLKTLCIFLKNKATLDQVSYGSGQKCSKELKNHNFPSVETIVVKLQSKMCKNQYFPCLNHK